MKRRYFYPVHPSMVVPGFVEIVLQLVNVHCSALAFAVDYRVRARWTSVCAVYFFSGKMAIL